MNAYEALVSGTVIPSIVLPLTEEDQYILRGVHLREYSISVGRDVMEVPNFGGPPLHVNCPCSVTSEISLVAKSVEFILGGGVTERVRDKRVEDCSVAELLFAIRIKVK